MSQKSLKIMHCLRDPMGGAFRHVRDLIDQQIAAGHKVGLICDDQPSDEHHELLLSKLNAKLELGLHRFQIARNISASDLKNVMRTRKIFKQIMPNIVHCHTAKAGLFGRLANAFRGNKAKCFYSPHGGSLHFDKSILSGRLVFSVERILEFFTDQIIFVCGFEQNQYADKIGNPRCMEAVVYNGLVDDDFNSIELNPNARHFLFIGMMRDLKGPDLFIKALSKTDASAVMVGEGPDLHRYEAMARGLDLHDRINFLPHMKTRNAFAMAECVVVPSRAESFPYIVLEAIAARRSLIASNVGGICEVEKIAPFELIEPNNYHALSEAMQAHMNRTIENDLLTLRSHALKGQFSAEIMADQIEELYLEIKS